MSDFSSFVSRDALVKSLQSLTGRSDVILLDDYSVTRGTTGVEGFTSLVLRVRLSYRLPGDDEIKSHDIFVKRMSSLESQRQLYSTSKLFPKEWLYFNQVFPTMAKVSAGRMQIPLPTCYHCAGGSDDAAFYLEDLIHSGFRAAHRSFILDGIDYPHCRIVMKSLGRLHALTLVAEKTLDPGKDGWAGSFPDFDRECVYYVPGPGESPSIVQTMVDMTIQNLKELSKEIDGLPKQAAEAGELQKALDRAWPTFCRLKETPKGNRRVLTHGDCWMNNIMFRYAKGEKNEEIPVDVKFYDLQIAKVCHPSIDLLHFMYTGTRRPFREKHLNTLIDEYYSSLTESLKLLDGSSPVFSLDDFKRELLVDYKPYGIILATLFVPIMLLGDELMLPNADDMTTEKFEEFYKSGNATQVTARFHSDKEYRSKLEDILGEFLEMAFPNGLESLNSSPLFREVSCW